MHSRVPACCKLCDHQINTHSYNYDEVNKEQVRTTKQKHCTQLYNEATANIRMSDLSLKREAHRRHTLEAASDLDVLVKNCGSTLYNL